MCTLEKLGDLFILKLTGDDEHRLNPSLIDSIRSALERITAEATGSSALITTAQGKFFSNGYDLDWASSDPSRLYLMDSNLKSLVFELFNFPMPTIAAVTGHASAAGLILAMSHDYVLMRKDRGFLYMSEIDIGLKIPNWFVALVRNKVKSPVAWRDVVMRGTKLTADVAIEHGIVDSAHVGAAETVTEAIKLGEELVARKWDGNVYAHNRRFVFSNVLTALFTNDMVPRL
ncbi:enoyl-CoA delta isomerase 1, peroxisomal-like [Solanum dulcamara]|uniref:enoyl-CoA delta isomerase 1, peroxisomal-like n=1 Tax=Solanum dulcamara TaxID=45834 RepID=UPI00248690A8|nr:enoyl-CoA delta isomerase 1, peroxisomal-like [Solanum dulcamara]